MSERKTKVYTRTSSGKLKKVRKVKHPSSPKSTRRKQDQTVYPQRNTGQPAWGPEWANR